MHGDDTSLQTARGLGDLDGTRGSRVASLTTAGHAAVMKLTRGETVKFKPAVEETQVVLITPTILKDFSRLQ